ncbi:MAG: c-type cytochrome [Paracoccaceae bacterium]
MVAALGLGTGAALAQEDAGKAEYMNACAGCHGESAMGNGPLSSLMNIPVPDLTGLKARNDGVFPMLDVIHTIDGRMQAEAHGGPMPIWGDRFKAHMTTEMDEYGGEMRVRGRILSLALYLDSIQK